MLSQKTDRTEATAEVEAAHARAAAVAMTALVDVRDWAGVQSYFAPQVAVDYTSLFPGKAETLPRQILIERWRALVPGFDATRHVLTDVEIKVDGVEAKGTARIHATHWLAGKHWSVSGTYQYDLRKIGNAWKISALTYVHQHEEGDRSLVDEATRRAVQQ